MRRGLHIDEKSIMAKGSFVVGNAYGLHARPATEIIKCISSFKSNVRQSYRDREASAASILEILMLGAPKGAKIDVVANGDDAGETARRLGLEAVLLEPFLPLDERGSINMGSRSSLKFPCRKQVDPLECWLKINPIDSMYLIVILKLI